MDIETLLNREIADELRKLKDMEAGTEEHKTAVDSITKLADRAIEIEKLNIDNNDKITIREEDKKDRFVKNCIAVAGIILPIGVTIWGTIKSIEFEKTGTITTMMGRGFINKLLPRK